MDLAEAKKIAVEMRGGRSSMAWTAWAMKRGPAYTMDWLISEVERLNTIIATDDKDWTAMEDSLTLSREEGRREGMMTSAEVLQSRLSVMMATPIVQAPVREWIEEHLTEVLAAIRSEAKGETHQG